MKERVALPEGATAGGNGTGRSRAGRSPFGGVPRGVPQGDADGERVVEQRFANANGFWCGGECRGIDVASFRRGRREGGAGGLLGGGCTRDFGLLLGRRQRNQRLRAGDVAIHGRVGGVVEEGVERIELVDRDRVVLVVMADGAAASQPHPGLHHRARSLDGVAILELGDERPAFARGHVAAIKARGEELVGGRIGQQVARKLPDGELVEGEVLVEGADHPVAIAPHLTFIVEVQAMGVGVAGGVEPEPGLFFAVVGRGEISVDHALVGAGLGVGEVLVDLAQFGRQPREGEGNAADERFPVGLGARCETLGLHRGEKEAVDRLIGPVGSGGRGELGLTDRFERPVLLVLRALFNPEAERFFLVCGQLFVGVRGRHHLGGVGRDDARPDLALRERAGGDGRTAVEGAGGVLGSIEAEVGLAGLGVKPVTGETGLREDGPDIAIELDDAISGGSGQSCEAKQQDRRETARGDFAGRSMVRCGHDSPRRQYA